MATWHKLAHAIVRSPVLWGTLAAAGFFWLLHAEVAVPLLGNDAQVFLVRYTAGHPIEYAEVGLFFIGLASLVIRRKDISAQLGSLGKKVLEPPPADGNSVADCGSMLERLEKQPLAVQESYLARRLRAALSLIQHKGAADGLSDELKYLSELDEGHVHDSYALARLMIWAVPILGFLGTVVGITMAIASIDSAALAESMDAVIASLAIAFDTTALALVLSMVLMFVQHSDERADRKLLEQVDERAAAELLGRFPEAMAGSDPNVAAIRRMLEAVVKSSETLVERQAELWQASLAAAQEKWSQTAASSGKLLEDSLQNALQKGLEAHARHVAAAAQQFAEQNQRLTQQAQQALVAGVQSARDLQGDVARQAALLSQLVQKGSQVATLEETLNRNLAALAGAHHFEELLASLAAVIHLLNARVAHLPSAVPPGGVGAAARAAEAKVKPAMGRAA
ncbi:MAG: MotA/TolQ/ExbB proton channel family protein [Planctomycetia bacterium]|nr:MotA/TolQ/ExbB proton channel family protein [Planctomycetia bacterium]